MEKSEWRRHIRQLRRDVSPRQMTLWSQAVCRTVEHHPAFRDAQVVMLYHALPDEVSLQALLDGYVGRKRLLLPRVAGSTLTVHPYLGPDSVAPGAFGILEPTLPALGDLSEIELAIVPGMAFDRQGHRLGRGRGYYDHFLPQLPATAFRLGVAFPFQVFDEIPTEPHDQRVDEVVF